jgi:hypothetical protein
MTSYNVAMAKNQRQRKPKQTRRLYKGEFSPYAVSCFYYVDPDNDSLENSHYGDNDNGFKSKNG